MAFIGCLERLDFEGRSFDDQEETLALLLHAVRLGQRWTGQLAESGKLMTGLLFAGQHDGVHLGCMLDKSALRNRGQACFPSRWRRSQSGKELLWDAGACTSPGCELCSHFIVPRLSLMFFSSCIPLQREDVLFAKVYGRIPQTYVSRLSSSAWPLTAL
jgi:hypothetical protein